MAMGEALGSSCFLDPAGIEKQLEPMDEEEVPTIDLSNYNDSGSANQVVREIGIACEKWGFFQVINHGVPMELLGRIETAAKSFFDQTAEEKRKVKRSIGGSYNDAMRLGFKEEEYTQNVRDWKEVFEFLVKDEILIPASHQPNDTKLRVVSNQWPHYPHGFKETCEEYAKELELLAHKLLRLISLSLGLPSGADGLKLKRYFNDDDNNVVEQMSSMRLNHYPPCPCPDLVLGVGPHTDIGALTILAQDGVGGLQVKRKSDGQWIPLKPIPNAYIVNIGDILQVWSNDKYESVEHRVVVNGEKERFSFPFFFFPAHHTMVKPLEELVNEQNPPKYTQYNFGKFFAAKNPCDFHNQKVENIQIDRFRLPICNSMN